jgi:phosphatidate cytidylyltransferase
MLKARIMTAIVVLPALLWLVISGPSWAVILLILASIFVSVMEMSMMIQPRLDEMLRNYSVVGSGRTDTSEIYIAAKRTPHYRFLAFFCALVMGTIYVVSLVFNVHAGGGVVIFGLVLAMLVAVFATRGIEAEMARVLGFTLTLAYAGFPWLIIWDLYDSGPNGMYLILVLAVVWLGDTGGYFGGRFLGRHQLSPQKSPKKTWEGAVVGLAASLLGAFAWYFMVIDIDDSTQFSVCAACGFFGGIGGQMGDLVESVIKRFTGVKDSGRLLPGHGGALDRIDGVLFAAPVIWFILYVSGVIGNPV